MDKNILRGSVAPGEGRGTGAVSAIQDELRQILGSEITPGTFKVILTSPYRFNNITAIRVQGGNWCLGGAEMRGMPVWIYRWRGCTLHIAELVAEKPSRTHLGLKGGDDVEIGVFAGDIDRISPRTVLVWALFWLGRSHWYY